MSFIIGKIAVFYLFHVQQYHILCYPLQAGNMLKFGYDLATLFLPNYAE
jgi:hypothetical protein